jgi:hypothetical protein
MTVNSVLKKSFIRKPSGFYFIQAPEKVNPLTAAGAPGFVWGSASAALSRVFTSRVSAPGMNAGACSGLTLSLISRPRLERQGSAEANGSTQKERDQRDRQDAGLRVPGACVSAFDFSPFCRYIE